MAYVPGTANNDSLSADTFYDTTYTVDGLGGYDSLSVNLWFGSGAGYEPAPYLNISIDAGSVSYVWNSYTWSVSWSNIEEVHIFVGNAIGCSMLGSARRDVLLGSSGNDILRGEGGDDVLDGQQGIDTLYGGEGKDELWSSFNGGGTLHGDNGNDRILIPNTAAVVHGFGDAGDDYIVFWQPGPFGDYSRTVADVDGGEDYDTLQIDLDLWTPYTTGVTLDFSAGQITLPGGSSISWTNIERIYFNEATPFKDVLTGSAGDDWMRGLDGPDELYGGAGDDTLYARDVDPYNDQSSNRLEGGDDNDTLVGANGADIIYGGDDNDRIEPGYGNDIELYGEGGDDTFVADPGNDRMYGGDGADTFNYQINTLYWFSNGTVQVIDGGDNLANHPDVLVLPGGADDYTVDVSLGGLLGTTQTTLTYRGVQLQTTGVELATFEHAISNIALLRSVNFVGNLYAESLQQAIKVYDNSAADAKTRFWHQVSAIELGLAPSAGLIDGYTFTNGAYVAELPLLFHDSACTILTGIVPDGTSDGARTLSIAFKGSNADPLDWVADFGLNGGTLVILENYRPLLDALKTYIQANISQIDQIIVSGHSLGGAMTQYFLNELVDVLDASGEAKVRGITIGSIGTSSAFTDVGFGNLLNFVHTGDVANGLVLNQRAGQTVWLNVAGNFATEHYKEGYQADLEFLIAQAASPTSPFGASELGIALRTGATLALESKFGLSVQVAPGTAGNDTIASQSADNFVVAGAGSDNIDVRLILSASPGAVVAIDTFATANGRIIDGGGAEIDTLIVSGKFSSYALSAPLADGERVLTQAGKVIGTLYNMDRIAYADGVRDLAGNLVSSQTSTIGASSFVLSDAFGFSIAAAGSMSVTGTSNANILYTGAGNKTINLGAGADVLISTSSKSADRNTIDGGAGADVLSGGIGSDTYIVDDLRDKISDLGGIDEIRTTVDFLLSEGIEKLTLLGSAFSAVGNSIANTILGNAVVNFLDGGAGNDTLDGGAGADEMHGGVGDDVYFVDNIGDATAEDANAGIDVVSASRSWAVASNIEKVVLTGTGNFNVAGNGLANTLRGNSGDNWLNGSFGKDVLTGGGGRDSFIFNRTLGPNNIDTITDYDVIRDVIRIDNAVFPGIGPAGAFAASMFNIGAAATEADDRIIYDPATGKLFFDIDGTGAAAQIHFATLSTKPTGMNAAEFIVI